MDFKYIHLRVKTKLKEQLMKEAKAKDISLTDYIKLILEKRKGE